VNSVVRGRPGLDFGTTSFLLTNRVAWYGTRRHIPYPLLVFRSIPEGHFVAAAYPYSEKLSTFVAECDAETWVRSGMSEMTEEERQAFTEGVFASELQDELLLSNKSMWRCLPVVRNRNWSSGNHVLLGDALHSAHPTIGSGTRIAMEDSIALAEAFHAHFDDVPRMLAAFRAAREPAKEKFLRATEKSFLWYEHFPEKMDTLAPVDFVFDFMMRTGRITDERLAAEFPEFLKRYGSRRSASHRVREDAPFVRGSGDAGASVT
jgi:2-polyprenyl-6-methoxyphenol hydroxylase-like FAD-dependent oxidoreductase